MPLRRFTPSPPGPACGPGPTRHVPIRRTVGAGPAAPRPDSDVSRPPSTQRPVPRHPFVSEGGWTHSPGKPPALAGNCGRAAAAPSRCRRVPPGGPIHRGRDADGALPRVRQAPRLPRHIVNPFAVRQAPRATRGQPDAESPAQVGRVYPKPPRCSPFGDENGVRFP